MYKDIVFPVSVEEFAAYLDGNLPEDEMSRVSSMIHNDSSMQELAEASQLIADTMDSYSTIGLELPKEILSMDFSILGIGSGSVSEPICDESEVAACAYSSSDVFLELGDATNLSEVEESQILELDIDSCDLGGGDEFVNDNIEM